MQCIRKEFRNSIKYNLQKNLLLKNIMKNFFKSQTWHGKIDTKLHVFQYKLLRSVFYLNYIFYKFAFWHEKTCNFNSFFKLVQSEHLLVSATAVTLRFTNDPPIMIKSSIFGSTNHLVLIFQMLLSLERQRKRKTDLKFLKRNINKQPFYFKNFCVSKKQPT